ncbi:MAG: xylulose kinase [Deltaproteobacteria bacterium]|nr:xylulose kinase [Deltaproteobacteria bacterium]
MTEPGDLVVGIDCSTTACKAVVWDAAGRPRAEGRAPIALSSPTPDAYEQDAEGWWRATAAAIGAAAEALGADDARRVRALCVAHQRESFVLTDEDGRPLRPALVWMDARCRAEVARAVATLGAGRLHTLSGKPPCTTPSLYKLMFLLAREAPELGARRPMVLDVHAFLVRKLTGRYATSLASADPMGLVDMAARDWSEPLLGLAGIERAQLPALLAPGKLCGTLLPEAAEACSLRPGLAVIAGAGDGQAAALGAGIAGPGRAYLNLGTAIVSGVPSQSYCTSPSFRTMYGAAVGTFLLETDLKGGTFTVDWLVERLLGHAHGPGESERAIARLEAEAWRIAAGSERLVVVPYWHGVMSPYWDDDASGILLGLRGHHGPAHLYRAILEGIALEQRLCTSGVEQATGQLVAELAVMGGGSKSALWCQILADATGKRVVRAASAEATALGAGILAAAAAGLHPDLPAAVRAMTARGDTFVPGPAQSVYDRLYAEVYAGLYPALRERAARLAKL